MEHPRALFWPEVSLDAFLGLKKVVGLFGESGPGCKHMPKSKPVVQMISAPGRRVL